jgi:tellurite resistance protein TehA-like permease
MAGMLERVDAGIRRLPPGAFAFVMATGIVSTAFHLVGWAVVSLVLLWVAIAGLGVLGAGLVWRLVRHPDAAVADASEPGRAFGYFTIVAAINVVGVRLFPVAPVATIVLGAVSVPLWILLTYGVPASLILREHEGPVATRVNGSWFLWVVGTQSLATAAAAIGRELHTPAFAAIAVALWGIGIVLYLMLATLVTLRLLTTRNDPASLGPSYWIYMGATAITVLAGSRILVLPAELPIMAATSAVVSGLTFVLWAFGVWWVPLLVIFGIWRHGIRRVPMRYESELWSIVFPLGMYSVASMHFGAETSLPLVVMLGEIGTWISGVAWVAVAVAMIVAFTARASERATGRAG